MRARHGGAPWRRLALTFAALCVGANLFLFGAGLRPFSLGLWPQSEPVVLMGLLIGACSALALATLSTLGEPVARALRHPLIACLGALTAWSAVAGSLTSLPMRSWFGAPETGQGTLSLLVLTVNSALLLLLWRRRPIRHVLVAAACLAVVALSLLNGFFPDGSAWRPGSWSEYQAFIGFFMMITLLCLPVRGRAIRGRALLTAMIALVIVLSKNRSAIILLALAPFLWWLIRALVKRGAAGRQADRPGRRPAWLRVPAPRVSLAALAALSPVLVGAGIAMTGALTGQYSSWSRLMLYKVALARLMAEPVLLLHGAGWGGYNDTLFAYQFLPGVTNYVGSVWKPTHWEGLMGGAFHPHNEALEVILALGVPGAALMAGVAAILIRLAPRRNFAAIATLWIMAFGLAGAWFMLPACMPFTALALAATVAARRAPLRLLPLPPLRAPLPPLPLPPLRARRWPGVAVAAGVAAALCAGALIQYRVARDSARLLDTVLGPAPAAAPLHLYADGGRGGGHLWWVALNFRHYLNNKARSGQAISADEARWFLYLIDAIDTQIAIGDAGLRLRSLSVEMRNDLVTGLPGDIMNPARVAALPLWQMRIGELLALAPGRSELAIPYLSAMLSEKADTVVLAFAEDVLRRTPDDPVALWFSGLALADLKPESGAGPQRLRRALENGIERFLPVDARLRARRDPP